MKPVAFLTHLPISVEEQYGTICEIAEALDVEDLAWISENRDFAETERYKEKDDVDQALLESQTVTTERRQIEQFFHEVSLVDAVGAYLARFQRHMRDLHDFSVRLLKDISVADANGVCELWCMGERLLDVDNAHAMYLSSDNWPFSVFRGILDALFGLLEDDPLLVQGLLSAGMQDVRTSVHTLFHAQYRGLTRGEFAAQIRSNKDWIRESGVMPILCYKAATGPVSDSLSEGQEHSLRLQFEDACAQCREKLELSEREIFGVLLSTYRRLYAARTAYDIYEYFGFYGFARHLAILRTKQLLASISKEVANSFHYSASTYQFSEFRGVLRELAEGAKQ
jgi:hypothetical protein